MARSKRSNAIFVGLQLIPAAVLVVSAINSAVAQGRTESRCENHGVY